MAGPKHSTRLSGARGFSRRWRHCGRWGLVQPDGRVATAGTRATAQPGLWLVGYGTWTGFASATLIGVGRTARATVEEIKAFLLVDSGTTSK